MTTLVTGAAGFLGSHVTRQLVARGEDVRVLMRPSSSNRAISDLGLEYVTGDLRDAASLERAMNGVKRVFFLWRRITGCGRGSRRIFTIRMWAGRRICWRRRGARESSN